MVKLGLELKAALARYKSSMVKFKMPFLIDTEITNLETRIIQNSNPQKAVIIFYTNTDVLYAPDFKPFDISILNSTKKHPFFLFANNEKKLFYSRVGSHMFI
jgi:hypothetical protein